jgi:hypothetical protein
VQIEKHWKQICEVVAKGQASTIYCSIASVGLDGMPNVTPIGTVFLRDNLTGYYFDHYTSALAKNLDANPNLCVMAVNSGFWFWLRSFWRGHFISPPGVRIYGKAGPLRPATAEEIALIESRVRPTKFLKGSRILWSGFTHVRDIVFTSFRPVTYPKMVEGLWHAGA